MIAVIESIFDIFKTMPYGEQTVAFIRSLPPDVGTAGAILGFFATAVSWGEPGQKYSGVRKIAEKIYMVSGVITGISCILFALYLIITQKLVVLFYICTLILGSVFNVVFQFFFQALGQVGYNVLLVVGCISGAAAVTVLWLYYNGWLLAFL